MRVLHVIDSLSASGGAEHGMVREIVRFSPETEQVVVRLFMNDVLEPLLTEHGIRVIAFGLRSADAGRSWMRASRMLGDVIESFRPDVIHSSLFTSNVVAQMAARRAGVPVLSTFTLSGDPGLLRRYQPGAGSRRAALLRKLAGFVARRGHVEFRSLTEDAADTNCRLLGVDRELVHVIPRGIPEDLRPSVLKTRAELGVPEGVPIMLNVGRQTAQKGHVALVETLVAVRRKTPAHLIILGREGDSSRHLQDSIASAGVEDHVTVVSYTPDVAHYLIHASVFVFSSYMEGLGTAVIEALSLGTPVVAFDIPPVREGTCNGRFARLVPVGDTAALAREVVETLTVGRSEAEDAAAVWARSTYSIGRVAADMEALLAHVAARV